jgi:phosphoglycolate phosphatase
MVVMPLVERFRAVAFDLDGTLIDTAPDIAAATNAMLVRLGYASLPGDDIVELIGQGIDRLVADALGRSIGARAEPAMLARATSLFRDCYGEALFVQSRVYPGVIDALDALAARGVPACCVTNKPSAFALRLLDAARAAGCGAALVDYGYHHGVDLARIDPDWIVGSIAQLLRGPSLRSVESRVA